MHFVMHAFNNHAEVPHDVTPIDLLDQSAVLSDGVVASYLHTIHSGLLKKYRYRSNVTACAIEFTKTGGEG